jgi:3-mercaptopyruvate sulfurtransferase SseA
VRDEQGFLAQGLELLLFVALLGVAGLGFWQLNRPLPEAPSVMVESIPDDAVLLDARGSLAYRRGHLPGAHQLWSRDLLSFSGAIPGMLAEPAVIAERLRPLGLSPGQRVIVYDDGNGQDAPLVVLALHAFGIDAQLFKGGLEAWLEQGGSLSTAPPPAPQPSDAELAFNRRLLVNAEETLTHLEENLIAPIDVRDQASYLEEHIEAAVNIQVERLLPGGGLPRWSALNNQLERARVTYDTHPLIYGADLTEAAQGWLALKAFGIPHIHVYAGPYQGLVMAGLPVSETVSERAISVPSSSVCWR